MTSRLIHSAHTRRQLAEAQAKHAARCTKVIGRCIICREHFSIECGQW